MESNINVTTEEKVLKFSSTPSEVSNLVLSDRIKHFNSYQKVLVIINSLVHLKRASCVSEREFMVENIESIVASFSEKVSDPCEVEHLVSKAYESNLLNDDFMESFDDCLVDYRQYLAPMAA